MARPSSWFPPRTGTAGTAVHRPPPQTLPAGRHWILALLVLIVPPAQAGRDCDAPPETWQPRSAVSALAERKGWQIDRLKIDDGCYEIKGRDADGQRMKAKLDPATLKVLRLHREHDGPGGNDERRRRQGPAASASGQG